MSPLDPVTWLKGKSYINGTPQSDVMKDYTKYYIIEQKTIEYFRDLWTMEFYSKHRLLDIDFETYYNMMNKSIKKHRKKLSKQY